MGRGSGAERDTAHRRRVLTAAGAAAATMAIAGTVGVLVPRADDDGPPARPPATSGVMPGPTPTVAASATASATSTPTATVSATTTPTATVARPRSTGDDWSDPVTFAGSTYRARFVVRPGERNHDAVLQRDGATVFTADSVFNTEGRWGVDEADPRLVYYLGGVRVTDLVTFRGEPVEDEVVGHVALPTPDGVDVAGEPYMDLHVTIVRTTSPNPEGVTAWVVQVEDGGLWDLSAD